MENSKTVISVISCCKLPIVASPVSCSDIKVEGPSLALNAVSLAKEAPNTPEVMLRSYDSKVLNVNPAVLYIGWIMSVVVVG